MFLTIINDCNDPNALGRQATRASSLFNINVNTLGISNDIEAAGNLIDVIDAAGDEEGIVLVNVAPRSSNWDFSIDNNGNGKHWENGTPFAYFKYKNITIISTIDGYTLSLVKKLNLVEKVQIFDIPTVTKFLVTNKIITPQEADYINNTQFRSFDFSPKVAKWLHDGIELPTSEYYINEIKDIPGLVWWIDNFGNCKTSLLKSELDTDSDAVSTQFGDIKFYNRLKDVPDNTTALIIGSSGIENQRFVELIVQGHPANTKLNVKLGDSIM